MLRSSGFLRVHFAASGIKKPSLERRAGLFRRRLAQRGLVDRRARMSESRRREGNSDHNERHAEIMPKILLNMINPPEWVT
jgi:hypothetical protein